MQIGIKNTKKIQSIGNKISNGLKLGNKLYNTAHQVSSLAHNASLPIENHVSNSQASIYHPTGLKHNSDKNVKKSYLEKH